jgi:hypothetical protein
MERMVVAGRARCGGSAATVERDVRWLDRVTLDSGESPGAGT